MKSEIKNYDQDFDDIVILSVLNNNIAKTRKKKTH